MFMLCVIVVDVVPDDVSHLKERLLIAHSNVSLVLIGFLGSTRAIAHCSSELAHILILWVFD